GRSRGALEGVDVAGAVPRRADRAMHVELDELPHEAPEIGVARPAADVGERRAGRQAPHHDEPVDDAVGVVAHGVIADGEASFRAHERHDAKIRVLREPTVQRDLELAVRATGFPIAEIDQSEANRLFQLVNESRREEDPGEMRLDGFDAVGTIREGAPAPEERDFLRERDFLFHVGMLTRGPKRAIRYYPQSFAACAIPHTSRAMGSMELRFRS